MTLTCDSSHRYHLDGREIPGCTRILEMAGISDYSAIREDILERAREIGTLTHTATQFLDEGGLDWNSVPELVKPRVDAWAKFTATEAFKPFPERIEYQTFGVVNGMAFGVRIDRAGLMRGRPAIVEQKCTASIMPHHAIQTAGQALAVLLPDNRPSDSITRFLKWERYVIQLRADGSFRLKRFSERSDADVFIAGLAVTTWKMAHGSKIREIEE